MSRTHDSTQCAPVERGSDGVVRRGLLPCRLAPHTSVASVRQGSRARAGPPADAPPALPAAVPGVALIVVLWLLLVLGVVASEVARQAHRESRLVAYLRARTAGRYAAESGVLLATSEIEALLDSNPSLAARAKALRDVTLPATEHDQTLGEARFRVAVIDLNARLDLNRANPVALANLFAEFTSESRAGSIVAALRQEPVLRVSELARVPGVDDSLARAVGPYLTVWSDGLVDINSAPEPVLAALPSVGHAVAQTLVRRREAGEVFTSPAVVLPLENLGSRAVRALHSVVTSPTRLLLVSRGWESGLPVTHEIQAVFDVVGNALVLEHWEERDR